LKIEAVINCCNEICQQNDTQAQDNTNVHVGSSLPLSLPMLGKTLSEAKLTLRKASQFLVACAGPALNVRVEHVSRDRYKDGCALAEVVSSFDTMGDHISNDTHERENV
ncbi:hypothetical protein Tco_0262240, partial [Tanacetum coccineum]